MIGYVTLGTNDLARAAKFYDAIAKELGVGRFMESENFIAWGGTGGGAGFAVRTALGLCGVHFAAPPRMGPARTRFARIAIAVAVLANWCFVASRVAR